MCTLLQLWPCVGKVELSYRCRSEPRFSRRSIWRRDCYTSVFKSLIIASCCRWKTTQCDAFAIGVIEVSEESSEISKPMSTIESDFPLTRTVEPTQPCIRGASRINESLCENRLPCKCVRRGSGPWLQRNPSSNVAGPLKGRIRFVLSYLTCFWVQRYFSRLRAFRLSYKGVRPC